MSSEFRNTAGSHEMVDIELNEVTKESWPEVMNLAFKLEQGGLVAPNFYRVREFKAEPTFVQLAVCHEGEVVGFAMYGLDPDDGKYWIYRLMIDVDQQRRGYGKAALAKLVEMMGQLPGCDEIYVGYRPENFVAHALHLSFGFKRTGEMLQGEYIARMDLKDRKAKDVAG